MGISPGSWSKESTFPNILSGVQSQVKSLALIAAMSKMFREYQVNRIVF
jgi:hypothetical protein